MITCKWGCGHEAENKRKMHPHEKFHCAKRDVAKKECGCADGGEWKVITNKGDPNWNVIPFVGVLNPETGKKYGMYCTECGEVV